MNPKDVLAAQQLLQQLVQRSRPPQQVSLPVNQASGSVVAPVSAAAPASVTSVVAAPVTTKSKSVNVSITTASAGQSQPAEKRISYGYKVKIINPNKKSDVVLRHLNGSTGKFGSVTEVRVKLVEEFGNQVPSKLDFAVGYYDGNQQSKTWLVTKNDLDAMYKKYPNGGNISLWCDGRSAEGTPKRNRDLDSRPGTSYRQGKEEEAETTYTELREKHGTKYDAPRLRLWARMIATGLHSDYDTPPEIPAFLGSTPKRTRRESFSDAISGAAVAFADAIKGKEKSNKSQGSATSSGVSPGRSVELRMKNYEQLRYLQQLYVDSILTTEEYEEQKQLIITSIRKL